MTGDALLHELRATLARYVVLPSPESYDAVTLWIAATFGQSAFEHAPRLAAISPQKRCGKSRLMDLVHGTCHNPLMTVNATPAAIFRSINGNTPTLLVDEADTIFGSKKVAENNEDLRGLLNAGHQRGRYSLRVVGVGENATVGKFETFAMAMLASIGDLPDTIMDRAIVVRMRRRAPGERIAPFRTRRDGPALDDLRRRLGEWIGNHLEDLHHAEPAMPVEDRAADTWEPLVAVADLAGGVWPARARTAALVFVQQASEADNQQSAGMRLLADVRAIFGEWTVSFLTSQDLVNALCKVEESPWRDDYLTTTKLAQVLRDYGIKPRRNAAGTARGYRLEDFTDAFARYLTPHPSEGVSPSEQPPDLHERPDTFGASDGLTRQTTPTRQPLTCASDDLTGSDAPTPEPAARGAVW